MKSSSLVFFLVFAITACAAEDPRAATGFVMEYHTKGTAFFSLDDLRFHWQSAEFKEEKTGICGGVECVAFLVSNKKDGSSGLFVLYRKTKWEGRDLWEVVATREVVPLGAHVVLTSQEIRLLTKSRKPLFVITAESVAL